MKFEFRDVYKNESRSSIHAIRRLSRIKRMTIGKECQVSFLTETKISRIPPISLTISFSSDNSSTHLEDNLTRALRNVNYTSSMENLLSNKSRASTARVTTAGPRVIVAVLSRLPRDNYLDGSRGQGPRRRACSVVVAPRLPRITIVSLRQFSNYTGNER